MKIKFTIKLVASYALLAGATAVFASGNHAGGHARAEESIGKAGDAAKVDRMVTVDMNDAMRFTPSSITVRQGETVRLVVKNSGKLKHELVLGTEKDLKAHYEVMKKNPEMEHAEDNMVTLAPGKTGELVWHFTQSGTVHFACLQPGHYDAGMKGMVTVTGNDMAQGEVRKIDKDNKKITIKHGEIKSLDMPGMTMVFGVYDEALLGKLKAGDKIRFTAEKMGGALVVTDVQPSP